MKKSALTKIMAVTMAAAMVFGSPMMAFATEPVTSGGSTGTGTSEGHVEKKVINVTLPTIPDGSTPFKYTVDSERLIQATEGGKYADGTTFPAAASDTGVYFLTGENKYENASSELEVINKSSHDVVLTVEVETEAGANDIELVDAAPAADETAAKLYLGLKVGDETKAVKSDGKVTFSKELAGYANNFAVKVDNGAYKYDLIESPDETKWAKTGIQMSGAVSKAEAGDKSAPTVKVTWKYEEKGTDAAPSIATTEYEYTAGNAVEVAVNLGIGDLAATGIDSIVFDNNGTEITLPTSRWSYSEGKITFNAEYIGLLNGITRVHKVIFNDNDNTPVNVTLKPAE